VVYEAPGRVAATLRDLAAVCGPDRRAAVCRELTKLHETIDRGTLGDLAAAALDGTIPARGEFALVVGVRIAADAETSAMAVTARADALAEARAAVERLVAEGSGRSESVRRVAAETGLPRRQLYDAKPDR
jgi:16S rRNA (cytidine1402-2'-O)-methyltransferase